MKVRLYTVTVTYYDRDGRLCEETFPVRAYDHTMATDMAVAHVLRVLKLNDFKLRLIGG